MNIKTNLIEEYVNFVDTTKKKTKYKVMDMCYYTYIYIDYTYNYTYNYTILNEQYSFFK